MGFASRIMTTGTSSLLAATALLGGVVMAQPAAAQDAASLQAIQSQIGQLQAQLRQLQRQAAQRDADLKKAQADAAQARVDSARAVQQQAAMPPPPAPGTAVVTLPEGALPVYAKAPASANDPVKTFQVGGVSITLGGYLDLTSIYRSRNLTAGASTPFNSIPFDNSANAHTSEFRETAQNTRLSVLLEGKPTSTINLAGYFEMDFNGAATTSNNSQSNSYTPRLRQAYVQADDSSLGLHGLAGQAWSLATGFSTGLTPRKEATPPVVDGNNFPGFVYTRAPQLRIVKDFDKTYWLGLSLETPQATFAFTPTTASGGTLPPVGTSRVGTTVTYNNPGSSFLNSGANYSIDVAPDIIAKGAVDTRFGHYEVYGLGRWFKSRTATVAGGGRDQVSFGGGVGGSAFIPLWPKYLEFEGNVLGGYGVGRYGSGQIADVSFKGDGTPAPLPEIIGSVGLLGHPTPKFDVYTFLGTEQIGRSTYTTTAATGRTTGNGYGTAYANVSGCGTEVGTVTVTPVCNAQTRALWDISAGGWWKFLHGSYGTVQAGVQYSYTKREAFHGAFNTSGSVGSTPSTDENTLFFSIRYLPFF